MVIMEKRGIIITIIVLVLVLVILIIGYFYVINKTVDVKASNNNLNNYVGNNCQKKFDEQKVFMIKELKCVTLCPIVPVADYNGGSRNFYDQSCYFYCDNNYMSKVNNSYKNNDNCYSKKMNELENDSLTCFRLMINLQLNEATSCINSLSTKYNVVLSDLTLPNYPVYSVSIESLDCRKNPAEINIKLIQGTGDIKLYLMSNGLIKEKDLEAPKLGETKTYTMNHDQGENITTIGVTLSIDGKLSGIRSSKNC